MRTRKPLRLRERDYRRAGLYFVTIGAQDRAETFGYVREGEFFPNRAGKIADRAAVLRPLATLHNIIRSVVVHTNHKDHSLLARAGEEGQATLCR